MFQITMLFAAKFASVESDVEPDWSWEAAGEHGTEDIARVAQITLVKAALVAVEDDKLFVTYYEINVRMNATFVSI